MLDFSCNLCGMVKWNFSHAMFEDGRQILPIFKRRIH